MAEYREVRIPTILRVMPLEGYRLRLELGSGSILELDMAGRLGTIRFCPLAEPEVFRSVTTDGQKLRFGKALEITASEVMDLAMIPPGSAAGGALRPGLVRLFGTLPPGERADGLGGPDPNRRPALPAPDERRENAAGGGGRPGGAPGAAAGIPLLGKRLHLSGRLSLL